MDLTNTDATLLLGRLEGKVDTLIAMHSAQGQRIDTLEGRVAAGEVAIASLQARSTTNQSVYSNITAGLALFVAAISAYLGYK